MLWRHRNFGHNSFILQVQKDIKKIKEENSLLNLPIGQITKIIGLI